VGFFDESSSTSTGRRWPKAGCFRLSATGVEVATAYAAIVSRTRSAGRALADAALVDWARPLGLQPDDGQLLSEFRGKTRTLSSLTEALEVCGIGVTEIKAGLTRLLAAGLVEDATA
jgi:hypothetical protein